MTLRRPRKPLIAADAAERWATSKVGAARGLLSSVSTVPGTDQRGPLRYWLRCCLVPGGVVKMLTTAELLRAWNDTSNATVRRLAAQTPTTPDTDEDAVADQPETDAEEAPTVMLNLIHKPEATMTPTAAAPASDSVAQATAALVAALQAQTPQAAPLDPAAVRGIVLEELAKQASTPRFLSVQVGERAAVTIDTPHPALDQTLSALAAGVNILLVGPAGCGKTTLAEQAAEALSLPLHMTGAVDSPYALRGFVDATGKPTETAFLKAFRDGGVFLFDEMDGSDPGALLAFNAALANGHADFPCGLVSKHPDFRVVAAANTYGSGASREYVGRSQLDAASLDRFAILTLDYDRNFERKLMGLRPLPSFNAPPQAPGPKMDVEAWTNHVHAVRTATRKLGVRHVVSTRAILTGAKLLAAGWTTTQVEDAVLWRGLDAAQVQRVRETAKGVA